VVLRATNSTRYARLACSRASCGRAPDGSDSQPSYLGKVVGNDVPGAGTRSDRRAGHQAANPDLILGRRHWTPDDYPQLTAIAPTVFTGPRARRGRTTCEPSAPATGRLDAAKRLIDGFEQAADKTGADNDATHFQASVGAADRHTIGCTGRPLSWQRILGAWAWIALRPQRFTDNAYVENGITDTDMENSSRLLRRRREPSIRSDDASTVLTDTVAWPEARTVAVTASRGGFHRWRRVAADGNRSRCRRCRPSRRRVGGSFSHVGVGDPDLDIRLSGKISLWPQGDPRPLHQDTLPEKVGRPVHPHRGVGQLHHRRLEVGGVLSAPVLSAACSSRRSSRLPREGVPVAAPTARRLSSHAAPGGPG